MPHRDPIRSLVLTLLLVAALPTAASEQALEPDRQYVAGTRVLATREGISFEIPAAWTGAYPSGSPAFVLVSEPQQAAGMVILRAKLTLEQLASEMAGPQDLGDGVVMQPQGEPERSSEGLNMRYAAGELAGHAVARVGPDGNAIVVFLAGRHADAESLRDLAGAVARSARFSAPAPSPSSEDAEWKALLAGMMLKRMSSYTSRSFDGSYVGGGSSSTLHLCKDGSYAYFSSSDVAADSGSGTSGYSAGGNSDAGRWRVEMIGTQATLVLSSDEGGESKSALSFEDGKTYLDGNRVFRVESDGCR